MQPFISICIPHYGNFNRTDYLIAAFQSFAAQSFKNFEVCVSDDASPDGRQAEIVKSLQELGLQHTVRTRSKNGRYDANLRSAIALAKGEYCLLMGNDDALKDESTLQRLADLLGKENHCGVLISDFEDYTTSARGNRILETREFPGTPETASRRYRNFAFVSGILFQRETAQALATERWDGSEMYQMWLGCRMISNGHRLLELAEPIIKKDIAINGQTRTGSYAWRPKVSPCPIVTRPLPFNDIGRVVCDSITASVTRDRARNLSFSVFFQLFTITYPYWLFEYRRVQSWKYAVGIALGMRPQRSMRDVDLGFLRRMVLDIIFSVTTLLALVVPLNLFQSLRPVLYRIVKSGN